MRSECWGHALRSHDLLRHESRYADILDVTQGKTKIWVVNHGLSLKWNAILSEMIIHSITSGGIFLEYTHAGVSTLSSYHRSCGKPKSISANTRILIFEENQELILWLSFAPKKLHNLADAVLSFDRVWISLTQTRGIMMQRPASGYSRLRRVLSRAPQISLMSSTTR